MMRPGDIVMTIQLDVPLWDMLPSVGKYVQIKSIHLKKATYATVLSIPHYDGHCICVVTDAGMFGWIARGLVNPVCKLEC